MSYLYEMHAHTSEVSGCGTISAKELARMYKDAGYDAVVITDHLFPGYVEMHADNWDNVVSNFMVGYQNAKEEGDKIGLKVFFGIELRFEEYLNDYLIYGADETFLRQNPFLTKRKLKDFAELITGTGIRIVQAHPFRKGMSIVKPALLHGVEIYNGNYRHDSCNDIAAIWAKRFNLVGISGSDFHRTEDYARGGVITSNEQADYSELIYTVFEKREFTIRETK